MKNSMKVAGALAHSLSILLIISLAASAAFGVDGGLPKPPKGFSWKRFDVIRAAVLVPRGWYVTVKNSKGERAVLITRDKMGNEDGFTTGFSLNAIKDIPGKYNMPPSAYATALLIEKMQVNAETRDVGPSPENPYFKGYKGFFRIGSEPAGKKVQYTIALGNDRTGTLYMITFESPEAGWDEAWKIGAKIMNNLALDEKY